MTIVGEDVDDVVDVVDVVGVVLRVAGGDLLDWKAVNDCLRILFRMLLGFFRVHFGFQQFFEDF